MSEEAAPTKPAARRSGPAYSGTAFSTMELVLEKLKILNYEKLLLQPKGYAAFTRVEFSVPARNSSLQLSTFLSVASWLFDMGGHEFTIDKFDNPKTSVNKVLLELKNLGMELFCPPAKLMMAYGEPVCQVLNFLCDRALDASGFAWQRPTYPEEAFAEEAEVDEDADIGAEIEEGLLDMEDDDEEEVFYSDLVSADVLRLASEGKDDDEAEESTSILEAEVDPLVWKKEYEEVLPRLKVVISSGKEWRSHLEQTRTHEATIKDKLQATKESLQQLGDLAAGMVEKVRTKESFLNNQFEHLSREYKDIDSKMKEVQAAHATDSERVSELHSKLDAITDRLDEVKALMDERGSRVTDTSPLVKIKAALQQIRTEIGQMELRIGVVAHTLLQAKIRKKTSSRKSRSGARSLIRTIEPFESDDDEGSDDDDDDDDDDD